MIPRIVIQRVFAGAALLVAMACAAAVPPRVLLSVDPTSLPTAAKDALNKKWTHWEIAPVDAQTTACLPAGTKPSSIVTTDFDSDDMPDIGAAVLTPQGVHLVALLARSDGYDLYDLGALGDRAAAAAIGIEHRGNQYMKEGAMADDYYASDTLTTYTCQPGHTSYLWAGLGFDKVSVTATTGSSSTPH